MTCIAAFALLGCGSLSGQSAVSRAGEGRLDQIALTGILRVGMTGDQAPLNLTSPQGEWLGMEVEIVQFLTRNLAVELEIVQLPFQQLLPAVEAGDVDMAMSGITITAKRNTRVTFVGPYFVSGKSILTRREVLREIPNPSDVNSERFRLAALAGSTSEAFVRLALPKAHLETTQTLAEAIDRVTGKEIHALVADYETCSLALLRNPDAGLAVLEERLTVEPIGIALRRGDTQLANLLENHLMALRLDGSLDKIYSAWLGDASWLEQARRSAGEAI